MGVKKQKGGVIGVNTLNENGTIINATDSGELSHFFIRNSRFKLLDLRNGISGIMLLATFRPPPESNLVSPYVCFKGGGEFGERVNTILIKINIISERDIQINGNVIVAGNSQGEWKKISGTNNDFLQECDNQSAVVLASIGELEPVAPIILFSEVLNEQSVIYGSLEHFRDYGAEGIQDIIVGLRRHQNISLGIIIMEYARPQAFTSLYRQLNRLPNDQYGNTDKNRLLSLAIFEILRLTACGYVHGDHHYGNFMISNNYQGYFSSDGLTNRWTNRLRCLIIDFGRTRALTQDELNEYNNLYTAFLNETSVQSLQNLMRRIYRFNGVLNGENVRFRTFNQANETAMNRILCNLFGAENCGVNQYQWIYTCINQSIVNNVLTLVRARITRINEVRQSHNDIFSNLFDIYNRLTPQQRNQFPDNLLDNVASRGVWSRDLVLSMMNTRYGRQTNINNALQPAVRSSDLPVAHDIQPVTMFNNLFPAPVADAAIIPQGEVITYESNDIVAPVTPVNAVPISDQPSQNQQFLVISSMSLFAVLFLLYIWFPSSSQHGGDNYETYENSKNSKKKYINNEQKIDSNLIISAFINLNNGLISIERLKNNISQNNVKIQVFNKSGINEYNAKYTENKNMKNFDLPNERQTISFGGKRKTTKRINKRRVTKKINKRKTNKKRKV
jgi:hypothetical protein